MKVIQPVYDAMKRFKKVDEHGKQKKDSDMVFETFDVSAIILI